MKLKVLGICAVLALGPALAACSDDDQDDARATAEDVRDDAESTAEDVVDEVAETADEGAARAQAEALRASVVEAVDDAGEDESARSVALVEAEAEELPSDVTLEGLDDGDGDGLDDDGQVTVAVDESAACVTLPESGTDLEVEGGAC